MKDIAPRELRKRRAVWKHLNMPRKEMPIDWHLAALGMAKAVVGQAKAPSEAVWMGDKTKLPKLHPFRGCCKGAGQSWRGSRLRGAGEG